MMIFWLTCLVGYPRTSAPEPLFFTAKHIVRQKPKSVTLCILQVKRESIIWKKKEGDKQILKLC